jgi:hypothetical protein
VFGKKGILPTTDIPTKANPYVAASSWATRIKHYLKFCIENPPNWIQSNLEEVSAETVFSEGAVRSVLVNQYERNREACTTCIDQLWRTLHRMQS